MQYNLLEFIESLEDPRRTQGQRYTLVALVSIIIMAIISGNQGLRDFTRFAKSNEEELVEVFQLKHGVPSFGTIRTTLLQLNCDNLTKSFRIWMKKYIPPEDNLWIAFDGKALGSTVEEVNTPLQNFVMVVSAFAHKSGLTLGVESFNNGKSGEGQAVRQLIASLNIEGAIFTMDALHTQKKL